MMPRNTVFRSFKASFLMLALAGTLHAQTPAIRGQVVDPTGEPVPAVAVTLHHVNAQGGQEVGRARTGDDGRFEIAVTESPGDGIFFVATRFEGNLYMGATFRDIAEVDSDYVMMVGASPVGSGGIAFRAPPPEPNGNWVVGLVIGLIGVGFVAWPLLNRRGPARQRALLAELAQLEEEYTALGPDAPADALSDYASRRAALRARLRATASRA